jgi:hypothetical protein
VLVGSSWVRDTTANGSFVKKVYNNYGDSGEDTVYSVHSRLCRTQAGGVYGTCSVAPVFNVPQ